ncbi:hypothetical protein CDD83_8905 [Cordyceps sp. RAO-2017]|nr:hypothetical protein CDD83_8905 [Cordyceps sp. RAO-2017]
MAADDLEVSSRVTLKGPGNWDLWISIVRKFAKNQQIRHYIGPAVSRRPASVPPTEPTAREAQENATSIHQLQADSLTKFQILEARHRSQLQAYKDREDDVAKELPILKNRVKPTDWARESEVTDRYHATLKAVSRTKVEEWISKWQVVLNEAKNLDLPDVKDLRPTRHVLKAVSAIDSTFSKVWINQMEANALSNSDDEWQKTFPDGIKISEIFKRSYRSTTSISDTKGAFSTDQGEGEPDASGGTRTSKFTNRNQGGKPTCLCGHRHFYLECYYLSELVRPEGWSPDSKVQEEIDQRLKDRTVKGKVERSIRNLRGTAFAGLRAKVEKNQGEKEQQPEQSPNSQIKSALSTTPVYPLRDSFIMDSGSDFHICNNSARFKEGTYKSCDEPEAAFSADTLLEIRGYGDVLVRIGGSDKFRLQNVAHIPTFHTNVASLDLFLKKKGYNWNPAAGAVSQDGKTIFRTQRRFRQPVIEYNQVDYESQTQSATAFSSSTQPRPESVAEAIRWHKRLGHLGSGALEHLVQHTIGAKIKGPVTVQCKDCAVSKARRTVSRRIPQKKACRPFWRIYTDVFALTVGTASDVRC